MKNTIHKNEEELTTLDINGHVFVVDFKQKRLIPKGIDEEFSKGIPFNMFRKHFDKETNRYEFPYDKKKFEFVRINYGTFTEIPENVILIGFPHLDVMDAAAYSISGGWAKEDFQDEEPGQKHYVATILKGKSDWLEFLARVNREKQKEESLKSTKKSRKMGR